MMEESDIFRINFTTEHKFLFFFQIYYVDEIYREKRIWNGKYSRYIIGFEKQIKHKILKFTRNQAKNVFKTQK